MTTTASRSRRRLPTGTVTFLFTDVEGSTRLLEAAADRWPALLADHDRLVRDAITRHDGVVVKTEGDGFFAAFASAADAVSAAADAQRAITAHDWPAGLAPRVRMGLHTGLGLLGGDDYVGIDVHRAARISAAAHGGQVVMSAPTAALVDHDLPDGVAMRDLGRHQLRGLSRAERILQLDVEGLEHDFPALRSLESVPNNLPVQVTHFVGRRRESARVRELLESSRVVTITGTGGTGKTRLALQVGAEIGARFSDGVYFVDLAPVDDPDVVPSQVLRALGEDSAPGNRLPRDALLDRLADREVLLILDNFEQVIAAASVVADLVTASPRSRFLVTSRGPLRIAAEQEMPLEPMQLPDRHDAVGAAESDAVALFLDRAMAVRPDFAVTPENVEAVTELVRGLDGLPLAIELVASRVRLLPVPEILARLDPARPGTGTIDLPERQRTIEGAIAWSHDLLDPPVRELFARLGVFAGGADLEQIERVCDDVDVDLLSGLAELVDQGLLRQVAAPGGRARFRTLHVIREVALLKLEASGTGEAIHRRHLQAYVDWAEEVAAHVLGEDRSAWLDRFDADHDNVRTALDWAAVHGEADLALRLAAASWRFWQSRGHLYEGRSRLETVVSLPGGEPANRARALEALGGVYWWQGEIDRCVAPYREALAIQREFGGPAEIANAIYNAAIGQSVAAASTGATEEVRREVFALYDEGEAIYRGLGDEDGLGNIAWGLGQAVADFDDDQARALRLFHESIEHYRRAGDEFGMGWGMFEVAVFSARMDDLETAWEYLEQGLELFAPHRDVSAVVMFLSLAAALAQAADDEERAARLLGAARGLRNSSGTRIVDHEVTRIRGLSIAELDPTRPDLAPLYRAGMEMSLEEAVASALGPTGDVRSAPGP
ncbi:putative HTH-type transcriptional regulator [Agromyces sp. NDB4Y10]|uniref:adenylate/guanylate cyclase domain-containing protein n=1 Tax=Agromyces sp. NDB4Y10 TaxID=1775951 RepID=UPI0007B24041|nr:adenylate/guanylate cyclase domain-containing protein [Agromyces sp. NDB4Y10]KZE92327.1 putative HTH-type transcriptional regulator [Agromyces sp. NDB4Y10]